MDRPIVPGGFADQRSAGGSETPVLDRAHLARYTLGDARLEAEVLGLFAGQLPKLLQSLNNAASDSDWQMATHTLKGSARSVGAMRLAHAAEAAEKSGFSASPSERATLIDAVSAAAAEATAAVASAFG